MTNQTFDEIILRYSTDQAALQRTLQSIETLEANFRQLGGEAANDSRLMARLGEQADNIKRLQSIDSITRSYVNFGDEIGSARVALAQLRADLNDVGASASEIDMATAAFERMSAASKKAETKPDATRGVNVGSLLNSAGQVLPGPAGDLARTAGDIENLVGSLGGIGPASLAAVAAFTTVTAALSAIDATAKGLTDNLAFTNARFRELYDLLSGTTDQALSGLDKTFKDTGRDQAELARLQAQLDETWQAALQRFSALGVGADAAARAALSRDEAYNQSVKRVAELQSAIILDGKLIDETFTNLQAGATAAADAAEAARLAAEKAAEEARQLRQQEVAKFDSSIQLSLRANDLAKSSSAESIQAMIERNDMEAKLIRATITELKGANLGEEGAKKIEEYQNRLHALANDTDALTGITLPLIRAREREAAATELQKFVTEERTRNIEELTQVTKSIADEEKRWKDVMADRQRADDRAKTNADYATNIANAKAAERQDEQAQKLAKLDDEHMADELKALRSYQDDLTKANRDGERERLRIVQDAERDLTDLAASRDVSGFLSRQDQARRDLQQQQDDQDQAAQERADAFARESVERQAQYESEHAQLVAAGQTRILESERLAKELENLHAQWAQDDQQRQRDVQDEEHNKNIAELRKRQAELRPVLLKAIEDGPIAAVKQFASTATTAIMNAVNSVKSMIIPVPTSQVPVVKKNATGGIYDQPTLALLGEAPGVRDFVFPVQQSEGIGAALNRVLGGAGAGGDVYIDLTGANFGDVASMTAVRAELREFGGMIVRSMKGRRN